MEGNGYWGYVLLAEYAVGVYVGHVEESWHGWIFFLWLFLVFEGFAAVFCVDHFCFFFGRR